MAYEPKEWACGDVVTADALNNIEQGIADAQLPSVTASDNGKVLGVDGGEYKLVEQSGGSVEWIVKDSSNSEMIHTDGNNIYCEFTGDLSVGSSANQPTASYYNSKLKNYLAKITNKGTAIARGIAIVKFQGGSTTPDIKGSIVPVVVMMYEDGASDKWTLRMILQTAEGYNNIVANASYVADYSFIIPIV